MSDKNSSGLRLKRGRYKTIAGKYYRTPKETWNFRTAARGGSPESIARDCVVANATLYKLEEDVSELAVQRVIRSLGAVHVIFKQIHDRNRVHRGYVTVHMDRSGRVYLSKNRSVPPHLLPGKFEQNIGRNEAARAGPGRCAIVSATCARPKGCGSPAKMSWCRHGRCA